MKKEVRRFFNRRAFFMNSLKLLVAGPELTELSRYPKSLRQFATKKGGEHLLHTVGPSAA